MNSNKNTENNLFGFLNQMLPGTFDGGSFGGTSGGGDELQLGSPGDSSEDARCQDPEIRTNIEVDTGACLETCTPVATPIEENSVPKCSCIDKEDLIAEACKKNNLDPDTVITLTCTDEDGNIQKRQVQCPYDCCGNNNNNNFLEDTDENSQTDYFARASNRCSLPPGCQLLSGTTQQNAEGLQCYREAFSPIRNCLTCIKRCFGADWCPLSKQEKKDIFYECGLVNAGICVPDEPTHTEAIMCVAKKVQSLLAQRLGQVCVRPDGTMSIIIKNICGKLATCIDEVVKLSMSEGPLNYIDSSFKCSFLGFSRMAHSWTEHRVDTDCDGVDDSILIVDTMTNTYYTCPL